MFLFLPEIALREETSLGMAKLATPLRNSKIIKIYIINTLFLMYLMYLYILSFKKCHFRNQIAFHIIDPNLILIRIFLNIFLCIFEA